MVRGVGEGVGRTGNFVGIGVQVGSPPSERTPRDNLMLAQGDELHVTPT